MPMPYFLTFAVILWTSAVCTPNCCLTATRDSLANHLAMDSSVSNITVYPGAACDTFAVSWDLNAGSYTIRNTKAYRLTGAVLRDWYYYELGGIMYPDTPVAAVDSDFCGIAVENRGAPPVIRPLQAIPNPFGSAVGFVFDSPAPDKRIEIFTPAGVKVVELRNIQGRSVTWTPGPLPHGIYLAKATIKGGSLLIPIYYLK